MTRVIVHPDMLRWARERSGIDVGDLVIRFPKLPQWESEAVRPTLKQLERFAKATSMPLGYLFLPQPLVETVPIPDFRTIGDRRLRRASPNLLDTIYLCQQRQEWYREHALLNGFHAVDFIGAATLRSDVVATAERMRQQLRFDLDSRRESATWQDALRQFIACADAAGVMVMCSGVVANNNHRRLNPSEFRGFSLSDHMAPLVFVNGSDTKSAQMFTLAHELAHLWLGQSALSDAEAVAESLHETERWCNAVAAELLVPLTTFRQELLPGEAVGVAMNRLARLFKVSTLVVLRRLFDAGELLSRDHYWRLYQAELERLVQLQRAGAGGNFYLSQAARVSRRFARALVTSTLEGTTLYRDAMRMVGVSKTETFHELARSLGMPV